MKNLKTTNHTDGYCKYDLAAKSYYTILNVFKRHTPDIKLLSDMHVTLMYDERPDINVTRSISEPVSHCVADIIGIDRLGEAGTKDDAIVLILYCPALEKRHNYLKSLGFKHSYPTLTLHMSILYHPLSKTDLADIKKNESVILRSLPKIILTNETWSSLKD